MKTDKQQVGDKGESIAQEFLAREGYEILETNWRFKRAELDIICVSPKGFLVFVEVKTKSTTTGRSAEEKVDRKKQEMIIKGALAYIDQFEYESEIRFDVITVKLKDLSRYDINHIIDAFWPGKW